MSFLPGVSVKQRPATGPGSLCAECRSPFTAQEWELRHTTGPPGAQLYTHSWCCWCAVMFDEDA